MSFTIHWDYITPYHTCLENLRTACKTAPLELIDITNSVLTLFVISISSNGAVLHPVPKFSRQV
jgi:hypothetical protein